MPVHTLHASLGATLKAVVHRENTPPLWYVLIWGWSRIFGMGEVALRLPSALAGVATVAVAWGIGTELAGPARGDRDRGARGDEPAAGVVLAGGTGVRAVRVAGGARDVVLAARRRRPDAGQADGVRGERRGGAATHYFAVFLLAPMCLWLLRKRERWRVTLPAVAVVGAVGLALVPLALAQGGHGTQWIGAWALPSRLEAIPQYYLTGYSGAPLGHGVELLVALTILAGMGYGLWRALTPREADAALLALGLAACGVLIPVAMAVAGADYLAPRNVVAAMVPLTAGIAVIVAGASVPAARGWRSRA